MKDDSGKKIYPCCHQHQRGKFAFKQNLKNYCQKLFGMRQKEHPEEVLNRENKMFCQPFKMKGHCRKTFLDPSLKNLADFNEGERLIVKKIAAGRRLKMNLFAMGINIDDEIEVLSNNLGQCLIMAGDKRFSLCPEIARLILVEPI